MMDIAKDPEGDIDLSTGDISFVESTRMHQEDILLANKGEYADGLLGVGIVDVLLDDADRLTIEHEIQQQFERDGMTIYKMDLKNKVKPIIQAAYV